MFIYTYIYLYIYGANMHYISNMLYSHCSKTSSAGRVSKVHNTYEVRRLQSIPYIYATTPKRTLHL